MNSEKLKLKKYQKERKALQIFTVLVASIPLLLGLEIAIFGMNGIVFRLGIEIKGAIQPSVDSTVRFLAIQFMALGLILLRMVTTIEKQSFIFRIIVIALFAGATFRLLSFYTVGTPNAFTKFVGFAEMGSAVVLWLWQFRIAQKFHKKRNN
jgi:hypothetical protein